MLGGLCLRPTQHQLGCHRPRSDLRALGLPRVSTKEAVCGSCRMNSSKTARSGPTIAQKKTDHSKGHVLIIALVGFVIGVVWPRLAGVSLVPEAPVEDEVQSDEDDAQATAKTAVPQEPELIELLPEDRLQVSPAKITSCVQGKDKAAKCDEIKVDDLVHPHLMALLGCPSAQGVFGTLSLGFRLDFEQAKISEVESG